MDDFFLSPGTIAHSHPRISSWTRLLPLVSFGTLCLARKPALLNEIMQWAQELKKVGCSWPSKMRPISPKQRERMKPPLAPIPDPSLLVSLDEGSLASAKELFFLQGGRITNTCRAFFDRNIHIVWRRGV